MTEERPSPVDPPESDPYPFGPSFFRSVLSERVEAHCRGASTDVAVVLLHLVDGRSLDLCHVAQVAPGWIAVAAFRDVPTCEEMDLVFVPYGAIHRITISARARTERVIGFRRERSATSGRTPPEPPCE